MKISNFLKERSFYCHLENQKRCFQTFAIFNCLCQHYQCNVLLQNFHNKNVPTADLERQALCERCARLFVC